MTVELILVLANLLVEQKKTRGWSSRPATSKRYAPCQESIACGLLVVLENTMSQEPETIWFSLCNVEVTILGFYEENQMHVVCAEREHETNSA